MIPSGAQVEQPKLAYPELDLPGGPGCEGVDHRSDGSRDAAAVSWARRGAEAIRHGEGRWSVPQQIHPER
jgi:hypothetical protein